MDNLVGGLRKHATDLAQGRNWIAVNGDSCEVMPTMDAATIGLTITSIPFQATYTYSPSVRDLGNVSSPEEFWAHMSWISSELLRVMMPGRLVCLHVQNLPRYANRDDAEESGRFDFRGDMIRHFSEAWGPQRGSNHHLHEMFPRGGPQKQGNRLAGLLRTKGEH